MGSFVSGIADTLEKVSPIGRSPPSPFSAAVGTRNGQDSETATRSGNARRTQPGDHSQRDTTNAAACHLNAKPSALAARIRPSVAPDQNDPLRPKVHAEAMSLRFRKRATRGAKSSSGSGKVA